MEPDGSREGFRSHLGAPAGGTGVDTGGRYMEKGRSRVDKRAVGKRDWISRCEKGTENSGQLARFLA